MQISIIILTKNAEQTLPLSLDAIFSQSYIAEIEVVIVDSGSTDKTVHIAHLYPVRLVQQSSEEFHHAKTRNMAASLATGDILVFLNGDAYPADRNWLPMLISHFNNLNVGAVYGKQIPPPGINPINQFRMSWHYNDKRAFKSREAISTYGPKHTYFFSTVSCAIRRSVWKRFRFPEDIPVYEDTAFIKNVINSGYKVVYEPQSVVYHAHNLSILEIFKRYFDTGAIYHKLQYFSNDNGQLQSEGFSYLKAGINFLTRKQYFFWIPDFIMHTAAGYLGLILGKHANKLPPSVRKLFSKYGT